MSSRGPHQGILCQVGVLTQDALGHKDKVNRGISELTGPGSTLYTQKSSYRKDLVIQMVEWDPVEAGTPHLAYLGQ